MKTFRQFLAEAAITNPVLPKQQDDQSNYDYFHQFAEQEQLSKISCVTFALYAAKLVQHLNSDQRVTDCINLVEKWLKSPESVSKIKLRNAANMSVDANTDIARVATYAAWIATNAVDNAYGIAWAATYAINADTSVKSKLLNYISYLLKKEPEHNNFKHVSLQQKNLQAYNFLEKISKLEDHQVTNDDLTGIYHVFDALEEIGMTPIDLSEFQWKGDGSVYNDVTEKHRLLQTIRREF